MNSKLAFLVPIQLLQNRYRHHYIIILKFFQAIAFMKDHARIQNKDFSHNFSFPETRNSIFQFKNFKEQIHLLFKTYLIYSLKNSSAFSSSVFSTSTLLFFKTISMLGPICFTTTLSTPSSTNNRATLGPNPLSSSA